MENSMTRRRLMAVLAAAELSPALARRTIADEASAGAANSAVPELKLIPSSTAPRYPAVLSDGQVIQPQRPLPVMHQTDVLVVGGGAAGFTAAIAAARAGAMKKCNGRWACESVCPVRPRRAARIQRLR